MVLDVRLGTLSRLIMGTLMIKGIVSFLSLGQSELGLSETTDDKRMRIESAYIHLFSSLQLLCPRKSAQFRLPTVQLKKKGRKTEDVKYQTEAAMLLRGKQPTGTSSSVSP